MASSSSSRDRSDGRYEHRVWGRHRAARKELERLASEVSTEQIEDCYLLVDDPSVNVKIRDNTLKIKQLIDERKGFEQWTSDQHESADTVPSPFDELFERLRLDRPARGKRFDLEKELERLQPSDGVRPVFVTKNRRRYRVGSVRAESTEIRIHETDEVLHTLSIVGDDLGELTKLRKRLGLADDDNVAVHQAIDPDLD